MTTTTPHRGGSLSIQVGPPPKPARERRRHRLPSWGLKSAMAISGLLWVAFVAIHLFGNLKVFQGADSFNHYAAWLREAGVKSKLILQVHDELVLEVPDDEVTLIRDQLPRLMAGVAQLSVPLVAEVGVGINWDEAH